MSQQIQDQLKTFKARAQKAQAEKIRLETRLQELHKRRDEIIANCQRRGVNVDDLPEIIDSLQTKRQELVAEIERLLPQ